MDLDKAIKGERSLTNEGYRKKDLRFDCEKSWVLKSVGV